MPDNPSASSYFRPSTASAARVFGTGWPFVVAACLSLSFQLGLARPVRGAETATMVDVEHVDEDFHFLGEYLGNIDPEADGTWDSTRRLGIQIAPTGQGEFIGMQYDGGLPGTGWSGRREQLTGERQGELVTLHGPSTRVEVRKGQGVRVLRHDGTWLGQLTKVQRRSPTLGQPAPQHALTLFDGTDTQVFQAGKMTSEGWLMHGTELIPKFRDYTLHIEFQLPYMPTARGQDRGNSGLYLQSSYEVQMLDSFGLEGIENECGSLYRYRRPDQNMCLPPLAWQTYDVTFRSPRFDDWGNKVQHANITVLHNGVAVHDHVWVENKTGAGKPESPQLWPIKLQDHGNPVRFRNIWLIDLEAINSLNSSCYGQVH